MSCCGCHKVVYGSLWEEHLKSSCSQGSPAAEREPFRTETKHGLKRPCDNSGKELSALAMEIHAGTCKRSTQFSETDSFPFVLVPPVEANDLRDVVKRHFLESSSTARESPDEEWDWSRLDELSLLNPTLTHYGRKGWFGYCVFEIPSTAMVVLETALRGNATYVVGSNWRDLISLTKPDIRRGSHERVSHSGALWLQRVERALSRP
jgi:hypothetical protein